jgi:translation initiation factor IF-2
MQTVSQEFLRKIVTSKWNKYADTTIFVYSTVPIIVAINKIDKKNADVVSKKFYFTNGHTE